MDSYWKGRNSSAAKGQPWAVNLYSSTMEDDDDDDDDEEDNSDEDADDEDSTLDGTNIDTSMVYSEDTGSMRSRRSNSSTLPSTFPLGGGGESSDGASLVSNSSSLLTTDNYFHRYDPDSNYIFTDDDDESSSPMEETLSEAESAALRLTLPADFGSDSSSVKSPTEWANLNQELGRMLAKTLIQKARNAAEHRQHQFQKASSDVDTDTEDDLGNEWKRSPSRHRKKRRTGDKASSNSIIGRAVQALARRKKQYTASTSPLDTARTLESASPSSIKSDGSNTSSSPSAVDTRNALAEFGDWEAQLHRSASRSVSPISCESTSIIAPRALFTSDDENDVDTFKIPTFEETSNFSDDDPVVIKAVTLIQLENGGGVMPFPAPRRRFTSTLMYHALEEQRSAEEVSQQLGLGPDGERLLNDLRSKMGMIDMDEDNTSKAKSRFRNIPLLEIQEGLWAPHYEEYVIRAVNDFAQHLTAS